MFVVSTRNILLKSKKGDKVYPLTKGYMGEIPAWACESEYFADLVKDGKIIVPASKTDKDIAKATEEKAAKAKKQ